MTEPSAIYLDNHSTTAIAPSVWEYMSRVARYCRNASSAHPLGEQARAVVDDARNTLGTILGRDPAGVVFTSGATEANNLALRGYLAGVARCRGRRPRLVVGAGEHSSVLATARAMQAAGQADVRVAPLTPLGAPDVDALAAILSEREAPDLLALMQANNEVGTTTPFHLIAPMAATRGVPIHVDACQSFARLPVPSDDAVAFVSGSAHKLYGPTGVGFLWIDPAVRPMVVPQTTGGNHEAGMRAGTINVLGIGGLDAAARLTAEGWRPWHDTTLGASPEGARLAALRDRLALLLLQALGERLAFNGPMVALGPETPLWYVDRLPHNLNVTVRGVCPTRLHAGLRERGLCVSAASACKALGGERSHVLVAMGAPSDGATVRFGLGASTTPEEIDAAADIVAQETRKVIG